MSIQNYLNKIKDAVFGKDIREAIYASIKQCYDDAAVNHDNANMEVKFARGSHNTLNDRLTEHEKNQKEINEQLDTIETEKATKLEVAVERKRVDNLVKISSGEVDNVEVSDARVGADGVGYDTVGEAIRTQFKNSNDKLDNIVGEKVDYPITWNDGGYINNTDGNLVIHEGWKYTDFIIIGKNTKELICKTTLTGSFSYNAFYDVNEKCISNFSVKNGRIAIPKGAYSFRLSVKDDDITRITKVFETLLNKCNAEDVKKIAEEVDDVLIKKYLGIKVDYSINWKNGGYISNTDGELIVDETWKYTDFIEIDERIKQLEIETNMTGSYSYNGFYDSKQNYIERLNIGSKLVNKPYNAKYIRLSVGKNFNVNVKNKIEKLIDKCGADEVLKLSTTLEDKIINEYIGAKIDYTINWIEGGYIDNTNGSFVAYNGWFYTDFIEIDEGVKQLEFDTTLTGSYSYNGFYDANETFIKSINVSNKLVERPSNAKYIRLSVNKGAKTTIKNKIDKLIDKCTLEEVKQMMGNINNGNNSVNATDIITLNKDVEPFMIQASEGLGQRFADRTKPLVFTHFSDVHTRQELWNRVVEYNNYYSKYINFSIHSGDYCGGNQSAYVDLYKNGQPCNMPIFNCVGNHDTFIDNKGTRGTKQKTKELLFNHTENWNVVFMDIEHSMTYYKDFPNNKIRFIVMDYYYDIDAQCTWLLERLNGAKAKGYHVVTCMHEMTNVITNKLDTPFQTIDNFEVLGGNKYSISKFDKVIGDWIKAGGIHVANFAGHEHSDFIGYTTNNVLNICVQAATDDIIWTDAKRVKGTRTWDCFNVVSVEVSTGTLKLIRVGNNSDHYLREKKLLSYDYINKRIISS